MNKYLTISNTVTCINECEVECLVDECKKFDDYDDGSFEFNALLYGEHYLPQDHALIEYKKLTSLRECEAKIKEAIKSAQSVAAISVNKSYNWYDITISMI